jgi:K+ transporter
LVLCVAASFIFFVIDIALLVQHAGFVDGGWFILIAGFVFALMVTWKEGAATCCAPGCGRTLSNQGFSGIGFVSPPVLEGYRRIFNG